MSEVKEKPIKITATLYVEMKFDCPKCDAWLDLFDMDYMNDDGQLWNLINARYDGDTDSWENLSEDGDEFECPNCGQELSFDKLEY